jgi:hypothetical protein
MKVRIAQLIPVKEETGELRFLVPVEPRLSSARKSLVTVFSRARQGPARYPLRMFRILEMRFMNAPARSLLASCVVNVGLMVLLIWIFPTTFSASNDADQLLTNRYEIHYVPPAVLAKLRIPKIAPAGPGGIPGQGEYNATFQRLGSTVYHSSLTAISQPKRPDNNHQTVIQPNIRPELRLSEDVHLPNLIVESAMPPKPRAPVSVAWHAPTPTKKTKSNTELAPPTLASTNPNSVIVILGPSTAAPAMPVQQPPPASADASDEKLDPAVEQAIYNGNGAQGGKGIVVLSTDPSLATGTMGLPLGNRAGSFSISPAGALTGSPGGVPGGITGSGHVGPGSGGDGSVGIGNGSSGGGGANGTESGIVSVTGANGGSGSGTLPNSTAARDMVVEMAPYTPLRKNALIVSTGQMGGGGLGVYQALPCRKIYTVFLPMPGMNWTLQYCAQDDSIADQAVTINGGGATVRMPSGLVPPTAELQFDFKRLPLPPEKSRKMIILKGAIREDGTVEHVEVYSGVLPLMDEAARIAFSRWKFTPALRAGKPVTVQILVGIAVTAPMQ